MNKLKNNIKQTAIVLLALLSFTTTAIRKNKSKNGKGNHQNTFQLRPLQKMRNLWIKI
jgi:hypothetical protein